MEFSTVTAKDRLDVETLALIGAAGHVDPVAAFRTFVEIGAAHAS
jgi:hypothetical protein